MKNRFSTWIGRQLYKKRLKRATQAAMQEALAWSESVLGAIEVLDDSSKDHGGHDSSTRRLHTAGGYCYLKVHQSEEHWRQEVHGYEQWAGAFGDFAPRLLAVREKAPFALLLSELHGRVVERTPLSHHQKLNIWRAAGAALAGLHGLEAGPCFGPCLRDGTCAKELPDDAPSFVAMRFKPQIERAVQGNYVNADELATLHAACELLPAFESARPTPCHRDYCAANWLADKDGRWTGVIDFEFAYWDVRVADLSRDPDWVWMRQPDLAEAFFEGYGHTLTPTEHQQLLVAYTEYALDAILWGHDYAFFGFEREGREALAHLSTFHFGAKARRASM